LAASSCVDPPIARTGIVTKSQYPLGQRPRLVYFHPYLAPGPLYWRPAWLWDRLTTLWIGGNLPAAAVN